MTGGPCTIPGCNKLVVARGWCMAHYQRYRLGGDVLADKKLRPIHGMKNTPEYIAWRGIKAHGREGMQVCERWRNDFPAFYADMGSRPSPRHALRRRERDKGYTPDNCYWHVTINQ